MSNLNKFTVELREGAVVLGVKVAWKELHCQSETVVYSVDSPVPAVKPIHAVLEPMSEGMLIVVLLKNDR